MDIRQLIKELTQSSLVAQCPLCQEEFKLSDWLLFDGLKKFPEPAEEKKQALLQAFAEREKELKESKLSVDVESEKKAIEIGFGTIIENFVPAYKGLKMQFCECRPLFEPIDMVVFNGLMKNAVDSITFLEIKSGNAQLKPNQRMIRDTINDGKVKMKVLQ